MIKLVTLGSFLSVIFLLISCSDSSTTSATTDSAITDSGAEIKQDDFISPDLVKYGNLHGHVKMSVAKRYVATFVDNEYVVDNNNMVYADTLFFSQTGILTRMSMNYFEGGKINWNYLLSFQYDENDHFLGGTEQVNNAKIFIERDRNGYLTLMSIKGENPDGVDDIYTEIKWKNGLPVSEEKTYWEWTENISYKYNDRYVVEKRTSSFGYEDGTESVETYEYADFDANNNWTSRKIKLDYAECLYDVMSGDEIERRTHKPQYLVEIREIVYW